MFKRVFQLIKIARRLSTSGAIDTINQMYNLPLIINLFFETEEQFQNDLNFYNFSFRKFYHKLFLDNEKQLNRNEYILNYFFTRNLSVIN